MDGIVLEFSSISAWHWLALSGIMLAIEVLVPSSWLLGPAVAAFITAMLSTILPNLDWKITVFVFSVLSIPSTIILRKLLKKSSISSSHTTLNKPGTEYIGKRFSVFSSDINQGAQIKIGDTLWEIETDNKHHIPVGAEIEVTSISGTTLIVKRLS